MGFMDWLTGNSGTLTNTNSGLLGAGATAGSAVNPNLASALVTDTPNAAAAAGGIPPWLLALISGIGNISSAMAPPVNPADATPAYRRDMAGGMLGAQAAQKASHIVSSNLLGTPAQQMAAAQHEVAASPNSTITNSGITQPGVVPLLQPAASQLATSTPTTPPPQAASAPNFPLAPASSSTNSAVGEPTALPSTGASTTATYSDRPFAGMTAGERQMAAFTMNPEDYKLYLDQSDKIVDRQIKQRQQEIENHRYAVQEHRYDREYQLKQAADARAQQALDLKKQRYADLQPLEKARVDQIENNIANSTDPFTRMAFAEQMAEALANKRSGLALDNAKATIDYRNANPAAPRPESTDQVTREINTAFGGKVLNEIAKVYPAILNDVNPLKAYDSLGTQYGMNVDAMLNVLAARAQSPDTPVNDKAAMAALHDRLLDEVTAAAKVAASRGNTYSQNHPRLTPAASAALGGTLGAAPPDISDKPTTPTVPYEPGPPSPKVTPQATQKPVSEQAPEIGKIIPIKPGNVGRLVRGQLLFKQDGYILDSTGKILEKS